MTEAGTSFLRTAHEKTLRMRVTCLLTVFRAHPIGFPCFAYACRSSSVIHAPVTID
jgi:hypothetical protein